MPRSITCVDTSFSAHLIGRKLGRKHSEFAALSLRYETDLLAKCSRTRLLEDAGPWALVQAWQFLLLPTVGLAVIA